jgi:hypothetical protein
VVEVLLVAVLLLWLGVSSPETATAMTVNVMAPRPAAVIMEPVVI